MELKEAPMNLTKFIALIRQVGEIEGRSKEEQLEVERRKYPRCILELPMTYSIMDGPERWGITADASEGGLHLYLHESIEKGTILKLELFPSWGLEWDPIKAIAKVVWSESSTGKMWGEHRHGLAFQAFQKKSFDRLISLLKEMGGPQGALTIREPMHS